MTVWLGALHALLDLGATSPATLVAGVAVAVLAIALHALTRPADRRGAPTLTVGVRRTDATPVPVRVTDPDAPGRARPRAPSR